MDPVFKALCAIRPLQTFEHVNASLAEAGADFTIEQLVETWPEAVPRPGVILGHQGVISSVIFRDNLDGVDLEGVAMGDSFDALQRRFPDIQHVRRQARNDGTACDVYVLDPASVVRHQVTVEDGRVFMQNFTVGGETETRIRLFEEARQTPPFAEVWSTRTHGFLHKGPLSEQLRAWAVSYGNDFHGNDWTQLADWLVDASTPIERHAFVLAYNWDHGVLPLAWVVHQPDTYLATLAEIFWRAEPGFFEEHRKTPRDAVDTDLFDLLWDIRDIVRQGRAAPGLAFNPGASAAKFASEDPHSLFVPLPCHPIEGQAYETIPDAWPVPIS